MKKKNQTCFQVQNCDQITKFLYCINNLLMLPRTMSNWNITNFKTWIWDCTCVGLFMYNKAKPNFEMNLELISNAKDARMYIK